MSDGLGTVRQTVDGVQAVTSILTTEAFGNTVSQWGTSSNPYRFAGLWGYRDDGDAGLLHVGARYYDPQVGRFISRDAVLSEHPYLYCEHEPVNAVDPSGNVPERLKNLGKQAADWIREYGGTVARGVTITVGTITGINLATEIYIVYKDWETSQRMRDMLEDWMKRKKKGDEDVDWELIRRVMNSHIRDAMRDIGNAAGDAAERIYRVRPGR